MDVNEYHLVTFQKTSPPPKFKMRFYIYILINLKHWQVSDPLFDQYLNRLGENIRVSQCVLLGRNVTNQLSESRTVRSNENELVNEFSGVIK